VGEFIFFAVLILFSILESIARKQKERVEGGERPPAPEAPRPSRPRRSERGVPDVQRGGERLEEDSSETLIPADIWEEIAGLASGRAPQQGRRAPGPGRRTPSPPSRRFPESRPGNRLPERPATGTAWPEAESKEALNVERIEDEITRPVRTYTGLHPRPAGQPHPVHRSHPEFGMDPSEREPSRLTASRREAGRESAKRVRAVLRGSRGADALREAVILREVLGPPAGLRDD
jgi:hypothetical protein